MGLAGAREGAMSVAPTTANDYLTPAEFGAGLGISRGQVVRLIEARRNFAINVGVGLKRPRWKIPICEFEKFRLPPDHSTRPRGRHLRLPP